MTAGEIAEALGGEVEGDAGLVLERAVDPRSATGKADLAVAVSKESLPHLAGTKAAAALLPAGIPAPDGGPATLIRIAPARRTLPDATALFRHRPASDPGIHPSAVVEDGAQVAGSAHIGPLCHIAAGAKVGEHCVLLSHVSMQPGSRLGEDGVLHPGVRIGPNVTIGARALVHANVVLGADGFSFISVDPSHVESAKVGGEITHNPDFDYSQMKVHSLGGVEIGDDVEIGANSAIDAGTLLPTRIGRGTKIDDLVVVAHNVQVGEDCLLCGASGVAGSVTVGDRCVLAGRVGVADNITIGDDVVVAGGGLVGSSLASGELYVGIPAIPYKEKFRELRNLKRLDRMLAKRKNSRQENN